MEELMYLIKLFAVLGLACSLACATQPLGKITTTEGVLINGEGVPQKTAPTWPVAANDEVATTTNPAVLMLLKNDRAYMDAKTSLQMEDTGGIPSLHLALGRICLKVAKESVLQIFALGEQLSIAHPFEGSVTLSTPHEKATVTAGRCRFPVIPVVAGTAAAAAAAAAGAAIVTASPAR